MVSYIVKRKWTKVQAKFYTAQDCFVGGVRIETELNKTELTVETELNIGFEISHSAGLSFSCFVRFGVRLSESTF